MLDNFLIGYEFEFGCNLTRRQLSEEMKKNGWLLKGNKPVRWSIIDDASIDTLKNYEHEVISPPMPGKEALRTLEKFLNFMQELGVETNESTGLHINVSFSDKSKTKSVDLLKLISSIPDIELADHYVRRYNDTCSPVEFFFNTNHRILVQKMPETREEKRQLILEHYINKSSKYHTVNLKKWKRRKYIEYRFSGNTRYEFKFKTIKQDIKTVLKCMTKACDGKISREADKVVKDYSMKFVKNPHKSVDRVIEPFLTPGICDSFRMYGESGGYFDDYMFDSDFPLF